MVNQPNQITNGQRKFRQASECEALSNSQIHSCDKFRLSTTILPKMISYKSLFNSKTHFVSQKFTEKNVTISKTIGPHEITVITDAHLYSFSLSSSVSLFSLLCLLTSISSFIFLFFSSNTLLTSISSHMSLDIHVSLSSQMSLGSFSLFSFKSFFVVPSAFHLSLSHSLFISLPMTMITRPLSPLCRKRQTAWALALH